MKERPILFSAPMVRALLAGKTQTRRIVKPQPVYVCPRGPSGVPVLSSAPNWGSDNIIRCPYGQPGDRLWVREAWAVEDERALVTQRQDAIIYLATHSGDRPWRGRPSIHMPRWASRITLEIVSVRVERLQDISEADAIAEGVRNSLHLPGGRFATENYAHLWWTINGDGSWEANPWVWVVVFARVP